METAIIIIGWLASICMIGGYLPQAIYTIRTRDTEGIALPTFLLMGFGSLFFCGSGHSDKQLAVGYHEYHHGSVCRRHHGHQAAQRRPQAA